MRHRNGVTMRNGEEHADTKDDPSQSVHPAQAKAYNSHIAPRPGLDFTSLDTGLDLRPLGDSWLHFDLALVLRNGRNFTVKGVTYDASDMHAQIVDMLYRSMLDVAFLRCSDPDEDTDVIVVLISANGCGRSSDGETLLEHEHHSQFVERFLAEGHRGAVNPPKVSERQMTTAKKIELTYRIVQRALTAVTRFMNAHSRSKIAEKCVGKKKGAIIDVGRPKQSVHDFVEACFPLHDSEWAAHFVGLYMNSIVNWKRWRAVVKQTFRRTNRALRQVSPDAHADWVQRRDEAAKKTAEQNAVYEPLSGAIVDVYDPDDWSIQELRNHMGERVGMFFAFLSFYSAALFPLAMLLVIFYVATRFVSWPLYMRGLSVLGVLVPAVWAPIMKRLWGRREATLQHDWGMSHVPGNLHPNAAALYKLRVKDARKGETERKFDPYNNRRKAAWCLLPIVLVNIIVMFIVAVPFAQWYINGRMAPVCSCCEWHMQNGMVGVGNATLLGLPDMCSDWKAAIEVQEAPIKCEAFVTCFESADTDVFSDRWFYVLLQGIVIGIALDCVLVDTFKFVARKLNDMEHWPTMSDYERQLVRKSFLVCWANTYFWFFVVAFIYIPGGDKMQDKLQSIGLGFMVPEYGWRTGFVNFDAAIVTPLIVTQAVNVLLQTALPYLCLRLGRHAVKIRVPESIVTVGRSVGMVQHTTTTNGSSSGSGLQLARSSTRNAVKTLGRSKRAAKQPTRNMVSERALVRVSTKGKNGLLFKSERMLSRLRVKLKTNAGTKFPVLEKTDDGNEYTYGDVVHQARLPEFHPRDDYLDMLLQLAYVCMFTVAWALAPVAAWASNVVELRFDCIKLFFTYRRPVPVEDPSIGAWKDAMDYIVLLALPVAAGLVAIGTGQLEYWMFGKCHPSHYDHGREAMDPDLDCFDTWGVRLMVAVVIERLGRLLVKLVNTQVSAVSPELQATQEVEMKRRERAIQDTLLPTLPDGLQHNLGVIFKFFDRDGNGILNRDELMRVLKLLKRGSEVKKQHVLLFLSFVDVDDSNTVSFAEFALALKRAQDDFVLREVLVLDNLAAEAQMLADEILSPGETTMPELLHIKSAASLG